MRYVVELVSDAMMFISGFLKISSGILKLLWEGGIHRQTDTHTQHGNLLNLLFVFPSKKSRLKMARNNMIV
jgi:hypothetical protein